LREDVKIYNFFVAQITIVFGLVEQISKYAPEWMFVINCNSFSITGKKAVSILNPL
jgi:hypothetical protein